MLTIETINKCIDQFDKHPNNRIDTIVVPYRIWYLAKFCKERINSKYRTKRRRARQFNILK